MFETILRTDTDRHVYTHFWDMHSGGGEKTDFAHIFIQAPEDLAVEIFRDKFDQDPHDVACLCCGPNFDVYEADSLAEATAFQRNVEIVDGVELWLYRSDRYGITNDGWAKEMKLTEYFLRPDMLVIQTRED